MSDLISRADAIEAVCRDCSIETKNNCKTDGYCYEVKNLMALPSADAVSREAHYDAVANRITDMEERGFVSVVRCKDCRYRKKVGTSYYCELDEFNVKDADFCSWGEREGGDSDD